MIEKAFYLDYSSLVETLQKRLEEQIPNRIQLVCGPRQVGKTTALLEVAKKWESQAIYVSMDGPEVHVPGFWERLWARAERLAKEFGKAVLLLDEIQHFDNWSSRLKSEWDRLMRLNLPIQIAASGSSSLQLGAGSNESLAGRFERLTLSHWNAKSLATAFQLADSAAVDYFVTHGSYPGSFPLRDDRTRWLAYVRDAIIEPAVGRDILGLNIIRRQAPLRQIFTIAAMMPAEIVPLQKMRGQMQDPAAIATISHHLDLLEHAFLIGTAHKFNETQVRLRQSPPKIVVLNQAICVALDPRGVPTQKDDPSRWDSWIKNACLAFLWNSGLHISYWNEEDYRVDALVVDGPNKWAIDIKTGGFSSLDLKGLTEFTRRHPKFRPLVLCDAEETHIATRIGLEAMPWREFLINGFPQATI